MSGVDRTNEVHRWSRSKSQAAAVI